MTTFKLQMHLEYTDEEMLNLVDQGLISKFKEDLLEEIQRQSSKFIDTKLEKTYAELSERNKLTWWYLNSPKSPRQKIIIDKRLASLKRMVEERRKGYGLVQWYNNHTV